MAVSALYEQNLHTFMSYCKNGISSFVLNIKNRA
jgi:hypothetical protein